MTPEQQRIAIAEACGWKWHSRYKGSIKVWDNGLDYVFWDSDLPDYLNDLNAMHEAEKVLNNEQWVAYGRELNRLGVFPMVHATASQRAEAFLRTLGIWEVTE